MAKKILVVDDDLVTLTLIQTLLESKHLDVVISTIGANVSEIVAREQPDILITDIMMPDTDGLENIPAIRRDHPNVVIVAISSEPLYLEFANKLGAHYCYKKPIIGTEFISLIMTIS